jgi:hypothetical protein
VRAFAQGKLDEYRQQEHLKPAVLSDHFGLDFEHFTTRQFERVGPNITTELRDLFRERGVYVRRGPGVRPQIELAKLVKEETTWPDDDPYRPEQRIRSLSPNDKPAAISPLASPTASPLPTNAPFPSPVLPGLVSTGPTCQAQHYAQAKSSFEGSDTQVKPSFKDSNTQKGPSFDTPVPTPVQALITIPAPVQNVTPTLEPAQLVNQEDPTRLTIPPTVLTPSEACSVESLSGLKGAIVAKQQDSIVATTNDSSGDGFANSCDNAPTTSPLDTNRSCGPSNTVFADSHDTRRDSVRVRQYIMTWKIPPGNDGNAAMWQKVQSTRLGKATSKFAGISYVYFARGYTGPVRHSYHPDYGG